MAVTLKARWAPKSHDEGTIGAMIGKKNRMKFRSFVKIMLK